jgi:hypothetical protein
MGNRGGMLIQMSRILTSSCENRTAQTVSHMDCITTSLMMTVMMMLLTVTCCLSSHPMTWTERDCKTHQRKRTVQCAKQPIFLMEEVWHGQTQMTKSSRA